MLERFKLLFEYESWANRRTLASLEQAAEHGAGVRFFAHILAGQEVWLTRLRGQDSSAIAIWAPHALEDCSRRLDALAAEIDRLLARVDEAFLETDIVYRNQTGREFRNTPLDVLTHLGLHSQHHRGQIALQLRQLGQTPAVTDFIAFRRERQ